MRTVKKGHRILETGANAAIAVVEEAEAHTQS
jgi:hypothetical protein